MKKAKAYKKGLKLNRETVYSLDDEQQLKDVQGGGSSGLIKCFCP